MSKKAVANEEFTVTKTPQAGAWVPGSPNFSTTLSSKARACGSKILVDKVQWTVSGCTLAGYSQTTPGSGTINATAVNVKLGGLAVVREDDEEFCSGVFTQTSTPFSTMACSCRFALNAGQNLVKAE